MPFYLAPCADGRRMKEYFNGAEVNYQIQGEGDSKVLLLHGWGCDMKMMQPVADALKTEHKVLLLDFPGHGMSGRPPVPWGVPEYAQCIKELLQKNDYIPCSVIAHSFGCRIAAWLASSEPSIFKKIVFTGAAGIRPRQSEESARRSAKYKKYKGYCESMKHVPLLKGLAERMEAGLRQKYGSRDYNALDEEMRKTFVKVINQDLSALYPQITQSTLLIWGDADQETPIWMAEEMEKMIPDAGLVILEGGSHFAYLEQIQRFNSIVSFFLKEDKNR